MIKSMKITSIGRGKLFHTAYAVQKNLFSFFCFKICNYNIYAHRLTNFNAKQGGNAKDIHSYFMQLSKVILPQPIKFNSHCFILIIISGGFIFLSSQ